VTLSALRPYALAAVRIALGLLALAAIRAQWIAAAATPQYDPAHFFGYFTILSNILAALVLIGVALDPRPPSRGVDVLRGAATFCMTLVGIIFALLLANLESGMLPWTNAVLHYLMPLVLLADWLTLPPRHRLSGGDAAMWLVIPLVYVAYTLARGASSHWYPYPFLNVDQNGWDGVAWTITILFFATVALAAAIRWAGNARPFYRKTF
jgi:hypothetical protein